MIEKLFGSTPAIMGDIISWLYLVAILVVLTAIACLLPKGATAKKVVGIVLLVGIVALFVVPAIVNPEVGARLWNGGFTTYLLVIVAAVLLYGLLCEKSKLAQALYGVITSVALPLGLLRILVPTWTNAKSFMEITSSLANMINLLIYVILFFTAVWLVASGTYRLNLSSIWHIFYGFIIFGSFMVFTTQAGLSSSHTALKMIQMIANTAKAVDVAILCALGLGVILVVSLVAFLWRKFVSKSGEKVIASETKEALALRLIGKIVSILASGALLVFLPTLMGATTAKTLAGMPGALLFLAPILLMAVIMLVFEFLAEDHEIKIAQEKHAAESAE